MRMSMNITQADYAEGVWKGKKIRFKRTWGGHEFTDEEVEALLNGEEISLFGLDSKTGSKYIVKGRLEEGTYNGHSYVGFTSTGFLNDDGSERVQGSSAKSGDYCTGVWKKQSIRFKRAWGGHEFTDEECKQLLAGKEISFEAVSKAGTTYTAKGKLSKQTYNGVSFVGFELNKSK